MSRLRIGYTILALSPLMLAFSGCGSNEPEPVAQAPVTPPPAQRAPPAAPAAEKAEEPQEGYGSEDYGAEGQEQASGSTQSSGGGGMSDYYANIPGMDGNDPYASDGDEFENMYGGGMSPGGMGPGGGGDDPYGNMYGMGSEIAGPGGPGGGGMGPGGMGGRGGDGFNLVSTFVRQNCSNCHGARQQKGGIRLDVLTGNFDDPTNASLASKVVEVLEAGSMPPTGNVNEGQKQQVIAFVKKALESSGALDRSYSDQAKFAFAAGKEKEALELLFAHAITASDSEASETFSKVRWFTKSRKPTTTLRFATGVILEAADTLEDLKPIGSSQLAGGGGMGMGGMGGMGPPGGRNRGGASVGPRTFNALTGDFGKAFVGAFEARWKSGDFGMVFNDVVAKAPAPTNNRGGGMGGMGMGLGGMGPGGMGGMGTGGMDGGDPYGDSYGGSYGGNSGGSRGQGGDGYGDDGGYGSEAASGFDLAELRPDIRAGTTITPGMVFIGTGSKAELMERAERQKADILFIFDVEATKNTRTNLVNNKTRLLCVLADGTSIGGTKSLLNTEVERAQIRGTDDPMQKNLEKMFALFDREVKLDSLPAFKPEHAMKRIQQLLTMRQALPEEEESEMDLNVMFEARMFHSMGILDDETLETVFQIVMEGNEGKALANGTEDDKKMVIDDLLVSN
ncbi:MAG: c-type cytochrome domain-containing protein [Pirellulaceae bacterium]